MTRAPFTIDRRVPLALVFTLFVQAGTAIWWASAKETQDHFRDQRIAGIEHGVLQGGDRQIAVLERLARLEAQGDAVHTILQRLETRLNKSK